LNPLIVKYATIILKDGNTQVPKELSHLSTEEAAVVPMSDFIAKLEQLVQNEHVVLITDSESTARCAVALNMTLQNHYIVVIRNGIVDATDALKEFELFERQLIDEHGNEYLLGENLVSAVYATEEGRVLCQTDSLLYNETDDVTEVFYKNNNERAGLLLSKDYNTSTFTGTIGEYIPVNVENGLRFLNRILEICGTGIPEILLMFGEKMCIVSVNTTPSNEEIKGFIYRVLFGADITENTVEHIINTLSKEKLPDYFLDAIDAEFIGRKEIPLRIWKNIAERYLIEGRD